MGEGGGGRGGFTVSHSGQVPWRPTMSGHTRVLTQEQLKHAGHTRTTACILTRRQGQRSDRLNQQKHPGQVHHRCCSTRTKHTHTRTRKERETEKGSSYV